MSASAGDLLIVNGRVVTESGILYADVAVRGETIARIVPRIPGGAADLPESAARRIDAAGAYILPGLIDPHVHLALPTRGTMSSDDPDTGTAAALFGGVTTIVDFTLQRPGESLLENLEARRAEFAGQARCDYSFHVNVTDFPRNPAEFDWRRFERELAELYRGGVRSLKVFTTYSREGMRIPDGLLRGLLERASGAGLLVLVHAEDDALILEQRARLIAAGPADGAAHARSRPAEAEARAIENVLAAAGTVGCPVYFVHVSTGAGVRAIRAARARGQHVYMETCPHYLLLDESAYEGPDAAQFVVTPPLRTTSDRMALQEALAAGEIDVVATDHCPFRRSQKGAAAPRGSSASRGSSAAGDSSAVGESSAAGEPSAVVRDSLDSPSGLPGIETRLVLLHTMLESMGNGRAALSRSSEHFSPESPEDRTPRRQSCLEDLARVTAGNPARIFGLYPRKGTIAEGSDADFVVFDPSARWSLSVAALHMNTDFSPYEGMAVRGRVRSVCLRGRMVVEEGKVVEKRYGELLANQ